MKHKHKFKPFEIVNIDKYTNTSNPLPEKYLILTCECGEVKKEIIDK